MKKLKVIFGFIGITLLVNLILAIITTLFHIEFLKPSQLIEGPKIFLKYL